MKVHYAWPGISLLERIKSWFPCRHRHYAMKWMKLKDTVTNVKFMRGTNGMPVCMVVIFCHTSWYSTLPSITHIHSSSVRNAWKDFLDMIAEHENMRNADELCIWLDMKEGLA